MNFLTINSEKVQNSIIVQYVLKIKIKKFTINLLHNGSNHNTVRN